MKISLYDYNSKSITYDIETRNILFIRYKVISGDELLYVYRINKTIDVYDSNSTRLMDFNDYDIMIDSLQQLIDCDCGDSYGRARKLSELNDWSINRVQKE